MTTLRPVLCAGIVVADHVSTPIDHVPAAGELVMADEMLLTLGGCAANVAVDLAKMGVGAAVLGRVGDDVFGRVVRGMLDEHGIDTAGLLTTPGLATSQTMVVNVAGQDRRFIHTFGANAAVTGGDIPAERVRGAKVLYVGGYLLMPQLRQEDLLPAFAAARAAGVTTVLDVALPGRADYRGRLDRLLPLVDVFLPNTDEAAVILQGEADPVAQAEAFRHMGAKTVVVTLGGAGAVLVNERERLRAGVYPVDFVDASGGGDAFDAGFIVGLLRGCDATGCLQLAGALGASCVRALGTTPGVFTAAECQEFMAQHALRIERG